MRVFIFKKRVGERKLFLKCIKFYMLIFEYLLSLQQILFNYEKYRLKSPRTPIAG